MSGFDIVAGIACIVAGGLILMFGFVLYGILAGW